MHTDKTQHTRISQYKNYYLSIGVFRNKSYANRSLINLQKKHIKPAHLVLENNFYHLYIGPIKSAEDARHIREQLIDKSKDKSRLIRVTQYKPSLATEMIIKKVQNKENNRRRSTHTPSTAIKAQRLPDVTQNSAWSITASIGYTDYLSMYSNDGETLLGRLAFHRAFYIKQAITYGLELGVQNGNKMRLSVPQATLDELGSTPIQSTAKPLLDLLATTKIQPFNFNPLFGEIKGGIAYRQWQFDDRDSINNLSNIAVEVQAGVGYSISQVTQLSLLYQGIFGGDPNFSVDSSNTTGSVSTIPIQQGVLLSLSHTLG